jgi:hypothetical protein
LEREEKGSKRMLGDEHILQLNDKHVDSLLHENLKRLITGDDSKIV